MEKRRGVAKSCGGEGVWKPGVQTGFRSRLSPDPACFLTRTRRRRAGAHRIPKPSSSHTVGCCYNTKRAAVAPPPRPAPLATPDLPAGPPLRDCAGSPACVLCGRPILGPASGSRRGWSTADGSLERPLRPPQGGRSQNPLRRGVERERRGQRRGAGSDRAAGGTSAPGPGRGRAKTGGSCSPVLVGGVRGSCAVHQGLFHICNNR